MTIDTLIATLHDTTQRPSAPGPEAVLVRDVWAMHAAVCARISDRLRNDFGLPDLALASVRHRDLFPYVERGASVTDASVPQAAARIQAAILQLVNTTTAPGVLSAYLRSSPELANRLQGSVRAGGAPRHQPLSLALNIVASDRASLSELMDAFTPPRGITIGTAS